MLPINVALVPDREQLVSTRDLLHVAAALQTQVTRDLGPVWGISGTVSPFESLVDVPPGYIPLAIVPKGTLLPREHGFHVAPGGQPIGLIEYRPAAGWSLLASHELIEMFCDPWGNRTVSGPSLADDNPSSIVDGQAGGQKQGQVEYVVEVCDPCQHATYTINGVLVSDFVIPEYYYKPVSPEGARYSFTGRVEGPRQLLPGGLISWCIRRRDEQIWQAVRDKKGNLTISRLTAAEPTVSRGWIGSHPSDGRPDVADKLMEQPLKGGNEARDLARKSAKRYGEALKADIDGILKSLRAPTPSLDDVIRLVEKLATDKQFHDGFEDQKKRAALLKPYNINPATLKFPSKGLPTMQRYGTVLKALEALKAAGLAPRLDQPDLTTEWNVLAMHGST